MPPASDLDPDDPFHPSALEPLRIDKAGGILGDAIERTFGESLDLTDDYRVVIAAARARSIRHAAVPT
jgi:hypothetical protein